jgi:hypothetical protein
MLTPAEWIEFSTWWAETAKRLGVGPQCEAFLTPGSGAAEALTKVAHAKGDLHYVMFVMLRYWVPPILPPAGKERLVKGDPDYWIESEQILKQAVSRLRQLRPFLQMLTDSHPGPNPQPHMSQSHGESASPPELDLSALLEGIAEAAGRLGGPDYTSVIKSLNSTPFRQLIHFRHNKKHSTEVWVIFLLKEHLRSVGVGKDRAWPIVCEVITAAGIRDPDGERYQPEELKSWWTKQWPRTYALLAPKDSAIQPTEYAYQSDYQWFQAWMNHQIEMRWR